jgi:tetratricopeptide (TPR) repeat protein
LRTLGFALVRNRGRVSEAVGYAQQALGLARKLAEPAYELDAMRMFAHVNNTAGRYAIARDLCLDGVPLARRLRYVADAAYFLGSLGDAEFGLGRYEAALHAYQEALPIFREHRLRRHQALCMLKMGESHQALRRYGPALACAEECLPIFAELRLPAYERRVRAVLSGCREAVDPARECHRHAVVRH